MNWKVVLFLPLFYFSCISEESKNSGLIKTDKSTLSLIIKANSDSSLSKKERLQLLSEADQHVGILLDNKQKTTLLAQLSLAYLQIGDTLAFKKKSKELIDLSKKTENHLSKGKAHRALGKYYRFKQPDSAFYHYKEAYKLFLRTDLSSDDKSLPGHMLLITAQIKRDHIDFVDAEKDIIKAIKYLTKTDSKEYLFAGYNRLGLIQFVLGKPEKAYEYYNKSKEFIPYSPKRKHFFQTNVNIANIANVKSDEKQYEEAISLYNKVLEADSLEFKESRLYANTLRGLAYTEFKNGETDLDKLSSAFLKAASILDTLKSSTYKATNYLNYAKVLHKLGKPDLALVNALKAKKIAKKASNNYMLKQALKLLTRIDKENSTAHTTAYFKLTKKIIFKERLLREKLARIELETDQAIQKNIDLEKQRRGLIIGGLVVVLLCLGGLVIIFQRNNNQKQQASNQEIYGLMLSQREKFQEGKHLEQKRISREIHDGVLSKMFGIRLKLETLNERNDTTAIKQRSELFEKIRVLEEELRDLSHELNMFSEENANNFINSLNDLAVATKSSSGINVQFNYTTSFNWDTLDGDLKINIYRIIQECLQNCIKHSKCNTIAIDLTADAKEVFLKVEDDGVGFYVNKEKKGIGLKNIASRIAKIDGGAQINSKIGQGTIISITMPIKRTIKAMDV